MLSRWRIPRRLGYSAMPLHPPGADPARTMDDDLVQLATLDRLGYEEAWIGEHFTAQCAKLSDDVGGFGTLLVIAHEWTPRGAWERSMRLLAQDVLQRLSRPRKFPLTAPSTTRSWPLT